jgi:hypothetical protein
MLTIIKVCLSAHSNTRLIIRTLAIRIICNTKLQNKETKNEITKYI